VSNRLYSVTVHIRAPDYPDPDEYAGQPQAGLKFIAAACRAVARAMLRQSEVDLAAAVDRIELIGRGEPEPAEASK
jgi:hypothetical protein